MLTIVVLCRQGEADTQELGYVVSVPRRRVRRAVLRNRLRRLLREALRYLVREAREALPFSAVGVVWRGAEEERLRRIKLADVVPPLRQLFQRAQEECR